MRRVHIWVKRSGDGGAAEILLSPTVLDELNERGEWKASATDPTVHLTLKLPSDGGSHLEEFGELTLRLAPEDTNEPVAR